MKAWQKLISVLTHEIMNSIAPIISLSETLSEEEEPGIIEDQHTRGTLGKPGDWESGNPGEGERGNLGEWDGSRKRIPVQVDPERYRVMQQAMETIHRRSKGLLSFVENYRKLTRLPTPVKQPIPLNNLFKSIQRLVAPAGIAFSYSVYPTQLILNADKEMMEQLLINLLKNANEACDGMTEKRIELKAEMVGETVQLTVSDNGQGISPGAMDKIFIPFYSTKASGSGIGLSLCRQIVTRHKGKISVYSDARGTRFTIEFP